MKYLEIAAAGQTLRMSKIVRGAGPFGFPMTDEQAFSLMDQYIELGGNTIDTARVYGKRELRDCEYAESEAAVGRWLAARKNRDKVLLVTKGGHPSLDPPVKKRLSAADIDNDIAVSLRELGVTYVDVYFLHRDDPARPVEEMIDALDRHVKAGEIRAIGASNWTCARIEEANRYARKTGKTPFTVSQIQWSLAATTPEEYGDPSLVTMNESEYEAYLHNRIPVMAFSSQASGYFSKLLADAASPKKLPQKYDTPENRKRGEKLRALCGSLGLSPASASLCYLLCAPVQCAAVIGCSTLEQQRDSMAAADLLLTPEQRAELIR